MTCIEALLMIYTTKPFRLAAAAIYRIAYKLHHRLFLRPQPPLRVPIVIVGSYLAGGAGKTPFTLWLAKQFLEQGKKLAVLCHSAAWDELILLQQELRDFQNATVIATKNRYRTAKEIQDKFDIILCDDGFEDTRFTGARYICIDWQEPPRNFTNLWPAGIFRSLKQDHDESDILHINSNDIKFSIEAVTNFIPGTPLTATVVCGLGNPNRFVQDVRTFGVNVEKTIARRDHDKRFPQAVQAELSAGNHVVISPKDACRLPQAMLADPKIHITLQKVNVSASAQKAIEQFI